jgi:SAM-dependent methyltransferase
VIFVAKYLSKHEIVGKRVIEFGSYDVNGTVRPLILHCNPAEYVGVDIENGPGVDVVCNAENVVDKFGKENFDIVISTELLEHVRDWRRVISNIKNVCAPGGIIVITTRSYGCGVHPYPYDFWRFQLDDMNEIFSVDRTAVRANQTDKLESDSLNPLINLLPR